MSENGDEDAAGAPSENVTTRTTSDTQVSTDVCDFPYSYFDYEQSNEGDIDYAYFLQNIPKTYDDERYEEEFTPIPTKPPHPFDQYSDEELVKMVEELQEETNHLSLENIVLENFLSKNEPNLLIGMGIILDAAKRIQSQQGSTSSVVSSRQGTDESIALSTTHTESILRYTGTNTATSSERGRRVNISQRTDMLMKEIEETQVMVEQFTKKCHRLKCNLKAELEEINLRLSEFTEARDMFEQTVVIKGIDPLTQRIPAEKFVRFMEEWLRSAELTTEKMRLRTSTLRQQYTKVCLQLTQREELRSIIHAVDFEQLKIENQHFMKTIEKKNGQLIELKRMTGQANLVLTNQKKILQKYLLELNRIESEIKNTEKKIDQLDKETEEVQVEAEQAYRKYQQLQNLCNNYRVPDVMEYVSKKAELDDLKRSIKVWSRRNHIQQIALSTATKQMKAMTGLKKVDQSWYQPKRDSTLDIDFDLSFFMDEDDEKKLENIDIKSSFIGYPPPK